jgi:periplasmic divalent cation tolerance protein
MEPLLVISNLPDRESADSLARILIDQRLAACVNLLSPCTSVYRWQGSVEQASEVPVLIKTTRERYPALEAAIKANHPYELPEIIAIPIVGGSPAYLAWVSAEVHTL